MCYRVYSLLWLGDLCFLVDEVLCAIQRITFVVIGCLRLLLSIVNSGFLIYILISCRVDFLNGNWYFLPTSGSILSARLFEHFFLFNVTNVSRNMLVNHTVSQSVFSVSGVSWREWCICFFNVDPISS